MEDHNLIDPVEKFRAEVRLQDARDLVARYRLRAAHPQLVAQVAGHDHHRVAEIHRAPVPIGQAAVIQQSAAAH